MSNSVPLKITIANHGTRRLNVTRDSSFEQFQQTVKGLFGIQNDLDWVYLDEENDTVTFSTEQEFKDALLVWNESKLLRLNATPRPLQRIEQPVRTVHPTEQAPQSGCPFSRQAPSSDRCCASLPVRVGIPLVLFYSIFTHPILTFIGLATLMVVTRHHYPSTYDKLSLHAKTHWRKVAVAYGLYMLFNCKLCTLIFAVPIGFILYNKFKNCHGCGDRQSAECCYVKCRDSIKQFLTNPCVRHSITEIVNFGQRLTTMPQPAPQPVNVPSQEQPKTVQPSAPLITEIYPSVSNEVVTEEPQPVLPERIEESFQSELEALRSMGFDNTKLNEHLLRNFNGNLDRVITSLLQLSSMK
jgi:hypothetical protein